SLLKIIFEIFFKLGKSFLTRLGLEPGPGSWLPSKCTTIVLPRPTTENNITTRPTELKGLSIFQSRALRFTPSGIRKLSQARKMSRIHLETSKKLACDNF